MCGIAGFYAPVKTQNCEIRTVIGEMLDKIIHRGPDASGVWIDENNNGLVLGHRRLSIIDLTETGAQPMMSHSGRYVISYNGEIYNTRYIIDLMKKDGYSDPMNGTSDTEVLIEAMEFYGPMKAIAKCKGMFAIAVYDRNEKKLFLARDRMGEKPLYYGIFDGAFAFASELPSLCAFSESKCEINYDCIADYLKYGYISAPHTIYKNIYKLEAGNILIIKCEINKYKDLEKESYWNIADVAIQGQARIFEGDCSDAADELERLLTESIRGQMVADVPLGAFLSAGIDSSTTVALMQSISERPVKTFTIGFEEPEYNEADAASEIAAYIGTDHTRLYVNKQDALDSIPLMPTMFGEPFADSSQIPTYLVSKLTRQHVTVSLSGDGGDELFAGYRDYRGVYNIYNKIKGIPLCIRKAAGTVMELSPFDNTSRGRRIRAHGTLLKASGPTDLYRRTYETGHETDLILGSAVYENRDSQKIDHTSVYNNDFDLFGDDIIHTAMLMNTAMYLPDDILTKVDRTAMSVSLETRIPLLDRDVVEFAWTLPLQYIYDGKKGKKVLRDVLNKYVDPKLTDRPKQGFGVPVSKWLREDGLREWAEDLLNEDLINRYKILNHKGVSRLWNNFMEKNIWTPRLWYILMLCGWLEVNA